MPTTRTVSVLFTDLVGSTALAADLGDDDADVLRRLHHERQRDVVTTHGGAVIKGLGDGIMAVFEGAAQAVAAATRLHEVTEELARRHAVPLELRVGVSAGDASHEGGDWFGRPVVEASRLCDAAGAGRVLVSDLVRQLAGSRTTHDFEPVEPLSLKGFDDPVVAHRVVTSSRTRGGRPSATTEEPTGALRLRLAGTFSVERGGAPLDERDIGSRKARTLLKVLAAARGRLVPMDELIDALWGDEPPRNADANVATLVSRLRGALAVDAIDGSRSGYRVAAVTIDVDEAEALVDEAETRLRAGQPALAVTAARAALDLLGPGRALEEEPAAEWALEVGREVDRLARRARSAAWSSSLALGDHRGALTFAQDAVAADPLDEEAHRAVIRAYHHLGEVGEALRAYEHLRSVLVEELGADPGPETEALYGVLLQGGPASDDPGATTATATAGAGAGAERVGKPGLVGRERELEELLEVWSQSCQGASRCALVTGQAGIGKSRLAAELTTHARAAGGLVLQTRCYEAERSLFLQPVVELVRAAVSELPPDVVRRAAADRVGPLAALVPEIDQVLRPVGYEPASGEIERRRAFEAVAAFLGGLARQRPLLVVLDDLQHAGASTTELLHFALRWDATAPLLIVATARREEADDALEQLAPLASIIEVGPLHERDVRTLAGAAGLADHADDLMAMTRGHTLFVVEALRALAEPDGAADGSEGTVVPESLRSAVLARVSRCGHEVEELLRAAGVAGSAFDLATVADLLSTSIEDVADRAGRAQRAGILVEVGARYELANDLIRDVLYDTTPAPVRLARHQRLATLLADRPEAAAAHAAAAGAWALAVEHWLTAGDRALATLATREAEQLFTSARAACDHLGDPSLTARVHLGRGRARIGHGEYAAAAEDLEAARQLARTAGAGPLEAEALTELGWCAYHARDLVQAGGFADRATSHPDRGALALVLLGRLRNTAGDLSGSIAILEPLANGADPAVNPAVRARALSSLGTALAHSDRYEEATRTLDEAVAACRHTGGLRGLLNARFFATFARVNLGDIAGGLACADLMAADVERYDVRMYRPRALNLSAWIWRELGDLPRADDLAQEALERSELAPGLIEGEPAANALSALAESALLRGDEAGAVARLDEIEPLLSDQVGYRWRIELRRLELLARMDPSRGEELVELARRHGSPKYEALGLGHLARSEEAATVARRTGSALLLAKVAPEPVALRAFDALVGALPVELRDGFRTRGLLVRRFADR